MKLIIDNEIKQSFPNLKIGFLIGNGINNKKSDLELETISKTKEKEIYAKFPDMEALQSHPNIQLWREIYKNMGSKPSKYRPTVEALIRRIIKGDSIPSINAVVNAYLVIELEYLIPFGGYDIDELDGDLKLEYSKEEHSFVGFGGKEEKTYIGEMVYRDSSSILTRRWNFKDCIRTQIMPNSKNIGLFTEIPSKTIESNQISVILNHLQSLLDEFCGGEYYFGILEVEESSIFDLSITNFKAPK